MHKNKEKNAEHQLKLIINKLINEYLTQLGLPVEFTLDEQFNEVIKSRYAIFETGQQYEFTAPLMLQLKEYLEDGADPAVLLESQRADYVKAIKEFLDKKPNFAPIWSKMKESEGHANTKLEDLPLDVAKTLFIKLTQE